jgi:hypothetical protein
MITAYAVQPSTVDSSGATQRPGEHPATVVKTWTDQVRPASTLTVSVENGVPPGREEPTSVRGPRTTQSWMATPPLRTVQVRPLSSEATRSNVSPAHDDGGQARKLR